MLLDARDLDDGAVLQADVCIVGAGPAGITMALEFEGSGLDVLLLESGGLTREDATDDLYRGTSSGLDGNLLAGRDRLFGGTSLRWAGWTRPLEPEDFQHRDWLSDIGWPFGFDEIEPFYRRAMPVCEAGAFEYDAQAISSRDGKDMLPFDPAFVETMVYQRSQPITRFGDRYRADVEDAAWVTAYLHANAVEVRLHDGGDGVRELRCATLEGKSFTASATFYVLATGGVENARLMLASNDQQAAGVGNQNDLVGRYFMEHPHYYMGTYWIARSAFDLSFYSAHDVVTVDDEHPGGLDVNIFCGLAVPMARRLEEHLPAMTMTLKEIRVGAEAGRTGEIDGPVVGNALLRGDNPEMTLHRAHLRCEQRPLADSRVTLGQERDALGMPRVDIHWQVAEQDHIDLTRTMQIIGGQMAAADLARLWIPTDESNIYRPAEYLGGDHHMGTTRMADTAAKGVVDADCRVHGLDNLYVTGSSVFPTTGWANPTLTIVAMAIRLVDHLVGRAG